MALWEDDREKGGRSDPRVVATWFHMEGGAGGAGCGASSKGRDLGLGKSVAMGGIRSLAMAGRTQWGTGAAEAAS